MGRCGPGAVEALDAAIESLDQTIRGYDQEPRFSFSIFSQHDITPLQWVNLGMHI